jgi:hypothetical protein
MTAASMIADWDTFFQLARSVTAAGFRAKGRHSSGSAAAGADDTILFAAVCTRQPDWSLRFVELVPS